MMPRQLVFLLAACLTAATAAADPAGDKAAADLIAQLTAGLKTDAQKALKLYESAQQLADDPAMQAAVLGKVVELGSKDVSARSVRAAVLAAIETLSKDEKRGAELAATKLEVLRAGLKTATAADRGEVGGQLLTILTDSARAAEREKQWARACALWLEALATAKRVRPEAAAELKSRADWAKYYDTATRGAEELAAKLKAAPDDVKLRTAVLQAYVGDLDDPKTAGGFLTAAVEESWRTRVPQANGAMELVAAPAARQLGQWYAGPVLAGCRVDFARILVLQRARRYFNRVLDDRMVVTAAERKAVLGELTAVEDKLLALGLRATRAATILISVDNDYELFINGRRVAGGRDWNAMDRHQVQLAAGDVIVVRAHDDEGGRSAGAFCCVVFRDRTLPSGKDWRCSLRPSNGWMTSGYSPKDKGVSFTNVAASHKGKKSDATAAGVFMWSPEAAGVVYFKLVVPR